MAQITVQTIKKRLKVAALVLEEPAQIKFVNKNGEFMAAISDKQNLINVFFGNLNADDFAFGVSLETYQKFIEHYADNKTRNKINVNLNGNTLEFIMSNAKNEIVDVYSVEGMLAKNNASTVVYEDEKDVTDLVSFLKSLDVVKSKKFIPYTEQIIIEANNMMATDCYSITSYDIPEIDGAFSISRDACKNLRKLINELNVVKIAIGQTGHSLVFKTDAFEYYIRKTKVTNPSFNKLFMAMNEGSDNLEDIKTKLFKLFSKQEAGGTYDIMGTKYTCDKITLDKLDGAYILYAEELKDALFPAKYLIEGPGREEMFTTKEKIVGFDARFIQRILNCCTSDATVARTTKNTMLIKSGTFRTHLFPLLTNTVYKKKEA